ncbi:unnamed protein product [Paramecium pentaurelia]|uniref:WD40-repeat-containing domain n=1 Tax=Paramecium pentaurelia TaxID=43138 RepID=A0A8S1T489_9CILI|nr:unnamed protein product [Paramecium pentaurelia]
MNSNTCLDSNHIIPAQFFCNNLFCYEDRLFWECCKNIKHSSHLMNPHELSKFNNYAENIKNDCQDLIKQINQEFEQFFIFVDKMKNVIDNYQLNSQNNFIPLSSEHLSNALNSLINFKENHINFINRQKENNQILNQFFESLSVTQTNNNEIKQFRYEIQNGAQLNEKHCYAMDFNKDATFLAAGFINGNIKVYNFNSEGLQLMQQLKEHYGAIYCIVFMKKSNQFISGGADKKINIWEINNYEIWQVKTKLQEDLNWIFCIITNINEDVIISGSNNGYIQFWKINEGQCFQTLDVHKDRVLSISLNQSQSKLISCACDRKVIVSLFKNKQIWIVSQSILLDYIPRRLCFINDNTFTIQCDTQKCLDIYELLQNEKEFEKTQEIEVKGEQGCYFCFPQKFISSKQLLLSKNGNQVNLLIRNKQNQFRFNHSINFETGQLWGTISDDGQYLATWDNRSCQIQIRKFIE